MNRLTSINSYYNENHIQPSFNFDDNATNIKYQSKKNRETLDDLILQRQKELYMAIKIKEDINKNVITKLEKILSKKFSLQKEDYIMLVDKFSLKSSIISRENIHNMVNYLNMQELYSKKDEQPTEDKYSNITYKSNNQSNISNIKYNNTQTNSLNIQSNPIDMEKISELAEDESNIDIEYELQKLIQQRETDINTNTLSKKQISIIDSNDVKNTLHTNIPTIVNVNQHKNITSNIDINQDINTNLRDTTLDNVSINTADNSNNINLKIIEKKEVMAQTDFISDLQEPIKTEVKTETFNLMINLLDNSEDNKLMSSINYGENNELTNVKYIELLSCFVNKNFYDKNNLKNYPYFIIKIKEFKDILYLNGTSISGFCQIMLEKKGNYYTYNNIDKLFGVYRPPNNIKLSNLEIELFTPEGQLITDMKFTENDKFNVTFMIVREIE